MVLGVKWFYAVHTDSLPIPYLYCPENTMRNPKWDSIEKLLVSVAKMFRMVKCCIKARHCKKCQYPAHNFLHLAQSMARQLWNKYNLVMLAHRIFSIRHFLVSPMWPNPWQMGIFCSYFLNNIFLCLDDDNYSILWMTMRVATQSRLNTYICIYKEN